MHKKEHYTNCRAISPAEAKKYLCDGIQYLTIASTEGICLNDQSCDCHEAILCTTQGFLLLRHGKVDCYDEEEGPGRIFLFAIDNYQTDYFDWKDIPTQAGTNQIKKIHYDKNGMLTEMKFLYGDRFLYVFSSDEELIVTKSLNELFDDEWVEGETIVYEREDSVLF